MTNRAVSGIWVYRDGAFHPVVAAGVPAPAPTAPDPPTGLDTTPGQTTMQLRWVAPVAGAEVDYFEYRVNDGAWVVAGAPPVNITGLAAGTVYRFWVRCVGLTGLRSAEVSVQSSTTSPPNPGGYSMRWGYTVGNNGGGSNQSLAEYDRIAAFMGQAEVIRHFNGGTTFTVPVTTYDARIPNADFIISWKPNYAAIMNGSQDAYILARVNAWPAGSRTLVLGAWHEWDVKKYGDGSVPAAGPQTEAQYAAMQHYLADLVHSAGRSNVLWAPILGAHNGTTRWATMLSGGLNMAKFDMVLYDPYRAGSPGGYGYANGYNQISTLSGFLANTWGMPYARQGIAEIGVGTTKPPDSQFAAAAEYGRGALTRAVELKLWCACWFEENENSYMLGNPPGSGPALTARPQILSMWQAMRAANP